MPAGIYYHPPREQWVKDKISNSMKGKMPKHFEEFKAKSIFKKGHPQFNTGRTHFKKGFTPWNKGKNVPQIAGERAYQWKGGTYEKDRKIDMGRKMYKMWRKMVFLRDGYRCIWCSSTKKLNADHIKSYSLYPELKYDLSNGRTLCEECHKKTDSYGNKVKLLTKEKFLYATAS
jgi:hypothetical protein